MRSFIDTVRDRANGNWEIILPTFNIPINKKEGPCPACGGNTRYRFDDKEGRGTYFCSRCGAGTGLDLVMKVYKCSAKEAAKKVNDVLGIYQQNDSTESGNMQLIRSANHWDTQQQPTHQVAKTTKSIADKVIGMLKSAKQEESTYLKNKGLTGMYSILNDGSLLLPLKKLDGTITGAQIIKPNGEKKLIYGSL